MALALAAACAPPAAHRTPIAFGDGGPALGGRGTDVDALADDGGPSVAPGVACGSAQPWSASHSYKEGDQVTHGAPPHVYQCKPWPYSGWCTNSAYEPGKAGGPWQDAWVDLGPCP